MIENFDNKYGTFVNDEAIIDPRYLKSGDIIYIVGLKIIVIGDCLYVNNLMRNVIFDLKYLELNNIENRVNQEKINGKNNSQENDDIYSEDEFFSRAPRIKLILLLQYKVNRMFHLFYYLVQHYRWQLWQWCLYS